MLGNVVNHHRRDRLSNRQHRLLVLGNNRIGRYEKHPFCMSLCKQQAVERVMVQQRQGADPQGVFGRYRHLDISMHDEHFAQSVGIDFKIFASEAQFDHNLPNTGRTEKKDCFRPNSKENGPIL